MAAQRCKASFIEPMLLLSTNALAEGDDWLRELKIDGYRAVAFKTNGQVHLRSRNDNDFSLRYPAIAKALSLLPNETVIDGELVALDESGKPSFHLLQNHGSAPETPLFYYVFDVMVLSGQDVRQKPLTTRRDLLRQRILPKLADPIRYSQELPGLLSDLVTAVKEQGFEGLVAKRRDSVYEAGERSGAWQKMRINHGQELVIGGYTPGSHGFDALLLGYYENGDLLYASRTRNGFTPATRQELFKRMRPLRIETCPFANLPEPRGGRWGAGLTAAKMKECRWLQPDLVGQFEFVEWTADGHLRHTKFTGLREDKPAKEVRREGG